MPRLMRRSETLRRTGEIFALPVDFVKPLINKSVVGPVQLKWGGHYESIKDYMHFEIKPDKGDRSNQELLEQLNNEEIINYLNSFEDEDRY